MIYTFQVRSEILKSLLLCRKVCGKGGQLGFEFIALRFLSKRLNESKQKFASQIFGQKQVLPITFAELVKEALIFFYKKDFPIEKSF